MTQLALNGATLGFEETLWDLADQMREPESHDRGAATQ